MSRKYKFRDPDSLYFISYATIYWLDIFIRNEYKELLIESWRYCQRFKGLIIHAWIIMTSHVHMIMSSKENKPEDIVRDMKSYTARQIYKDVIDNPHESRQELFNHKMIDQKLEYLHNNQVVEGIVDYPENYLYSSARDYCGEKGLLDNEIIR